jgi:hypothetical protein
MRKATSASEAKRRPAKSEAGPRGERRPGTRTELPGTRARRTTAAKPRPAKKGQSPAKAKPAAAEASISKAQAVVVASKFGTDQTVVRPAAPPTLPLTYGESHLLLLARDPQTLFAAWDMSPLTVQSLKARVGGRSFAVSTITLRLMRSDGDSTVHHLPKKVRSRYLKVGGGATFVAEVGFTAPNGRFELIARSAPCVVPLGAAPRAVGPDMPRRAVAGYREARTLALKRLGAARAAGALRAASRPVISPRQAGLSPQPGSAPRVIGGASDLYRR